MIVRKLWLNHGKINGQPHRVRFASMSKLKSDLLVGLFGADCGPYMPAPLAPAVPLRSQRVEQSLGLIQIERVEALGEPAVDRSENAASRIPLAPSSQSRAMLIAARSSQDLACCARATPSARSKYASAFAASGLGDSSAISPAVRWISASHNFSLAVSTAVIASPMQRQASSRFPMSA